MYNNNFSPLQENISWNELIIKLYTKLFYRTKNHCLWNNWKKSIKCCNQNALIIITNPLVFFYCVVFKRLIFSRENTMKNVKYCIVLSKLIYFSFHLFYWFFFFILKIVGLQNVYNNTLRLSIKYLYYNYSLSGESEGKLQIWKNRFKSYML